MLPLSAFRVKAAFPWRFTSLSKFPLFVLVYSRLLTSPLPRIFIADELKKLLSVPVVKLIFPPVIFTIPVKFFCSPFISSSFGPVLLNTPLPLKSEVRSPFSLFTNSRVVFAFIIVFPPKYESVALLLLYTIFPFSIVVIPKKPLLFPPRVKVPVPCLFKAPSPFIVPFILSSTVVL